MQALQTSLFLQVASGTQRIWPPTARTLFAYGIFTLFRDADATINGMGTPIVVSSDSLR